MVYIEISNGTKEALKTIAKELEQKTGVVEMTFKDLEKEVHHDEFKTK
jgi:hypothetical protein